MEAQTIFRRQGQTHRIIVEGQIIELVFTFVGNAEAIFDVLLGIVLTLFIGHNNTAVVDLGAVLISLLLGDHRGVGHQNVGGHSHVGTPTVTFHVVEVNGVVFTVDQVQAMPASVVVLLGRLDGTVLNRLIENLLKLLITDIGTVAIILLQEGHLLLSPQNVVVHLHLHRGDGVSSTDIQHQLPIDKEVNVIIALKLEEQIILVVVNKLRIGLHYIIVVTVHIGITVIRIDSGTILTEVRRAGAAVVPLRIGHRQEGVPGGPLFAVVVDLILTDSAAQRDSAGFLIVNNSGNTVRVGLNIAGGEACIEHIGFFAGTGNGSLAQNQVVVIVLKLVVGVVHKQVVHQIEGCIVEGLNIPLNLSIGSNQLLLIFLGGRVGALRCSRRNRIVTHSAGRHGQPQCLTQSRS